MFGVDEPADEFLASCYRNALTLADQHELRSVAFPALSTGASGYPMEAAGLVALTTVAETAPTLATVQLVRRVGRRVRLCPGPRREQRGPRGRAGASCAHR